MTDARGVPLYRGDRVAKPAPDGTSELRGTVIDILGVSRPYLVRWSGGRESWEHGRSIFKRHWPTAEDAELDEEVKRVLRDLREEQVFNEDDFKGIADILCASIALIEKLAKKAGMKG